MRSPFGPGLVTECCEQESGCVHNDIATFQSAHVNLSARCSISIKRQDFDMALDYKCWFSIPPSHPTTGARPLSLCCIPVDGGAAK